MSMANEKRLIAANDVYALFDKNGFAILHVGDIDTIPRVDAVEVVHGRWIVPKIPHITVVGICSECGKMSDRNYNFCPNCGADMRGEEDA